MYNSQKHSTSEYIVMGRIQIQKRIRIQIQKRILNNFFGHIGVSGLQFPSSGMEKKCKVRNGSKIIFLVF